VLMTAEGHLIRATFLKTPATMSPRWWWARRPSHPCNFS